MKTSKPGTSTAENAPESPAALERTGAPGRVARGEASGKGAAGKLRGLPSFLSIGAQKCATTWLYNCLKQHPDIHLGPKNRIRYFEPAVNARYDLDWYRNFFRDARPHQIIGEFRVEYLFVPETPALIHRTLPASKFLVNLRNPVDRAVSAYLWNVRRGLLPDLDLDQGMALALGAGDSGPLDDQRELLRRVVTMGFYDEQLERYLALFEPEQFLFLLTDEIERDPVACIRAVFRFLGVDSRFVPSGLTAKPLRSAGLRTLTTLERATSGIYGTFKVWELANRLAYGIGLGGAPPRLGANGSHALEMLYAPHNRRLRGILDSLRDHPSTTFDHLNLDKCRWLSPM